MSPRHRFATFTLLLLFSACFPFRSLCADGDGNAAGLLAKPLGGEWGYIDKTGQMVIAPQDDEAYPFSDGLANVELGKKVGYIDKTGKYVWAPTK